MPLPVVPPAPSAAGCGGCSRREILRGLAATAATVVTGCPSEDPGPEASASMCGDNLCIDLDDPANAALLEVDGSLIVRAPRDRIIVVRTSATMLLAVSDICTHAACGVRYQRASHVFDCPCHGSRYSLTGAVLQGPANRPLAKYRIQVDPETNLLTIFL
jgi:cytochrome b6-f complex iron-sulfur subunit